MDTSDAREDVVMARGKRRRFSMEFKAEAVKLVLDEGRIASQVARELDVPESSLYTWVQQSRIDRGKGPKDALTTAEKQELSQLRREVKQLRMEREILKKAAAFFAKENG
jgi:transposase